MDLLKNARIRVAGNWTTGATSNVGNPIDCRGAEDVTILVTVPQTTTITSVAVQGSATTVAGDFAALSYNSTAVSISSTVTGGCHVIQINHNTYPWLKVAVNSTGVSSQVQSLVILSGLRSVPTTQASTEVVASMQTASPST